MGLVNLHLGFSRVGIANKRQLPPSKFLKQQGPSYLVWSKLHHLLNEAGPPFHLFHVADLPPRNTSTHTQPTTPLPLHHHPPFPDSRFPFQNPTRPNSTQITLPIPSYSASTHLLSSLLTSILRDHTTLVVDQGINQVSSSSLLPLTLSTSPIPSIHVSRILPAHARTVPRRSSRAGLSTLDKPIDRTSRVALSRQALYDFQFILFRLQYSTID
jgi:hypothetical protein